MSFVMPKFDLSNPGISKEEYAQKSKPKGGFGIEPGRHALKIKEIKPTGLAKGDDTFVNVEIEFENAAGKTMRHWIMIPTVKIPYGAKGTTFVFEQLCTFMAGLGIEVNFDNAATVLPKYLSNIESLKGLELQADVGYDGVYAKYNGPGSFTIGLKNGQEFSVDGEVVQFPDRDSALSYAGGIKGKDRLVRGTSVLKVYKKEIVVETAGW